MFNCADLKVKWLSVNMDIPAILEFAKYVLSQILNWPLA